MKWRAAVHVWFVPQGSLSSRQQLSSELYPLNPQWNFTTRRQANDQCTRQLLLRQQIQNLFLVWKLQPHLIILSQQSRLQISTLLGNCFLLRSTSLPPWLSCFACLWLRPTNKFCTEILFSFHFVWLPQLNTHKTSSYIQSAILKLSLLRRIWSLKAVRICY